MIEPTCRRPPTAESACLDKHAYPDRGRALKALCGMRRHRKLKASDKRLPLAAYRCPFCDHWHLGH